MASVEFLQVLSRIGLVPRLVAVAVVVLGLEQAEAAPRLPL